MSSHEIHRPALARTARQRQRHPLAAGEPLPPAATDLEARLAIHPVHAFVIRDEALAGDQRVQPTIPVPWPHGGMRLQTREQLAVVDPAVSLIAPRRGAQPDEPTRPPEAGLLRVHEPPHRPALGDGAYHFFATTAFNA